MKFLMQLLMGIRTALLKIADKIFNKMKDPDTGKIKFGSPKAVKKILVTAFFVFIAGIAAYQIFNSTFNPIDGIKNYDTEISKKLVVTAQEIPYNTDITGNPLSKIQGFGEDNGRGNNQLEDDDINPKSGECLILLNKLKKGETLGLNEKKRLKYCLENNLLGLSPEELNLAQKLLDNGLLSAEEKKLYNELFSAEPECKDTFEKQIVTSGGNRFIAEVIGNKLLNEKVIELLKNQSKLRQAIITPNGLETYLGLTSEDVQVFKALLENCSPELLIKMLTDPKMKGIINKLLAEALNNPDFIKNLMNAENLSPEEEELLRRFLKGEISIDDPDYAIAEALLSSDPRKRDTARKILDARFLGETDIADALLKQLNGEELTPEEADLVNIDGETLRKAAEAKRAGNNELAGALLKKALGRTLSESEEKLLGTRAEFGNISSGVDKEALGRALADDIAKRQAEMDAMREELARAQAAAREAAERLSQGLPLTPAQQAALQRFAELQKRLSELQETLQKQKDRLAKLITGMQSTIDQIGVDFQTIYPSGMTVSESNWTRCKDIKPLIFIQKQKNKTKIARSRKKGMTGIDGKELSPDQIKIIKLMRRKKADDIAEQKRIEKEFLNAGDTLAGQTSSLNSALAQGGANQGGVKALIVSENNDLRPFELAPDLVVPGLLLTRILTTDKGSGQKVRVKITTDVYDLSGKIVIPRNSIAFGTTGGFDVDTYTMNITLDTVSVGGRVVDVSFDIGSADLSPGLKGEVRDTRGKLLLGAFISSFTSGAIGALSQNFIAPFQNSEVLEDSLTGAALQGTASIAQRIASLYAGDLQQAARIFFAPANIRVVLTPSR
jgi:hypothetical protein